MATIDRHEAHPPDRAATGSSTIATDDGRISANPPPEHPTSAASPLATIPTTASSGCQCGEDYTRRWPDITAANLTGIHDPLCAVRLDRLEHAARHTSRPRHRMGLPQELATPGAQRPRRVL
ncbi:hypothetical protein GCM10009756_19020 [Pseudokineococcus marinus]